MNGEDKLTSRFSDSISSAGVGEPRLRPSHARLRASGASRPCGRRQTAPTVLKQEKRPQSTLADIPVSELREAKNAIG